MLSASNDPQTLIPLGVTDNIPSSFVMAQLLTSERGDCCENCQTQCSPDSLFLEILQDSPTCKFIDNLDIDLLVFLNPSQTEDLHKELESLCTKMPTDIGRIEADLMKVQTDPSKPLPKLLHHSLKLEQQQKKD